MYDPVGSLPPPSDDERKCRHRFRCERCGEAPAAGTVMVTTAIVWILSVALLFVVAGAAWWVVRNVASWAF